MKPSTAFCEHLTQITVFIHLIVPQAMDGAVAGNGSNCQCHA